MTHAEKAGPCKGNQI